MSRLTGAKTERTSELPAVKTSDAMVPGLAAWIVAIVIGCLAQRELTPPQRLVPSAALFLLASIVTVVGASWIDRCLPLADPMRCDDSGAWRGAKRHPTGRDAVGLGGIGLGLVLTVASVCLLAITRSSAVALPLWLLALVVFSVGLGLRTAFPWGLPRDRARRLELIGVFAVVLLALVLRAWNLSAIPADVHGDEAAVGLAAQRILDGSVRNLFGLGWASLPQLSFAASALSLRAFGNDLFGLRMASVIQGSISVALLYGMVKRLFSIRIAALSAIFLATAQMAIHFSRIGTNYVQALFVSLLLFYFLLRGLQNGQSLDYLFAGFSVGLALGVYIAARLTPLLVLLYLLHRAISERGFVRQQWRGLAVLVLGAGLFIAPQLVYYVQDPANALTRTSEVFVISTDNLAHEYDAYKVSSVGDVLRIQAINTIEAFNVRGETSLQYGQRGPLLDFWSGVLFVLGVAVATSCLRQPRYFLLAAWLWLTLLFGSVLTVDAMFSPHVVALLGTVAVLPALVVEMGWRGLAGCFPARRWALGLPLVAVVVVLIGWSNYVDYFEVHAQTMEPPSFFTVLARYLQGTNDRYRVYLLADRDTSLKYDTVRFLVPSIDGVDGRAFPLVLPLARIPDRKGVVFVERDPKDPRFAAIKREYPRGAEESHSSRNGFVEFYSYRVARSDLLAANPGAYVDHGPIPATDLNRLNPG